MRTIFVIFLLPLVCFAKEITYDELVKVALVNSTAIKLKSNDVQIEEANMRLLQSKKYPQFSLAYNSEYYKNLDETSQSISAGDKLVNSSVSYKNSLGLSLLYDLYDFGAKDEQLKAQKQEINIKTLELCTEETKIKEEILKYYSGGLGASYDKQYLQQIRMVTKQIYEYKKRLFDSGMVSFVDVSNDAIRLIDLENKIDNANKEYQINITALDKLSYGFVKTDDILSPFDVQQLGSIVVDATYHQSYIAQQYKHKLAQKEYEKNSFRNSNFPQLSFSSNYYFYGSDQEHFKDGIYDIKDNSYNIALAIRVNLFEGFKYKNQLDKFELEIKKIYLEDSLAKENYDKEIAIIKQNITQLATLIQGAQKSLIQTKELQNTKIRLKENGEVDMIVKLQSEVDSLEKELSYHHQKISFDAEQIRLIIKYNLCNN